VKKDRKKDIERPANLVFWLKDGMLNAYNARVPADVGVSIGRTDSERALGFYVISDKQLKADFVLDRDQCTELAAYLELMTPGLRKPQGRKPPQLSMVPMAEMARQHRETRRRKRRHPRRKSK